MSWEQFCQPFGFLWFSGSFLIEISPTHRLTRFRGAFLYNHPMNHNTQKILLFYLLVRLSFGQNSYMTDWFWPDVVIKKADPFNLLSSNFGQPSGNYNWNQDQWKLMGRTRRTCNGCTQGGKHVIVANLTVFVNDEEYFIKAMCYNPVPLGILSMDVRTGIGGGGLCSARRTPFGATDFKSACYDTDFFDGGDSPGRVPPGPADGWFTGLWNRDFPIIKEAGANTVRIYNANPTTRAYTEEVISGQQTDFFSQVEAIDGTIVAPPYGNDHTEFMDAAFQAGLMVIFPLIADATLMQTIPQAAYERFIANQIDEIGNHPALLMYTMGNELDIENDTILAMVNTYIQFSRQYSMTKWGRSIPITHALIDIPSTYNNLYATLDVDIFTTNAGYRGLGFTDLWDGTQTPGFSGLGPLSIQYNKPNFVGEIGWPQVNNSVTSLPGNAGWFNIKWADLINKGTPAGCVGGAFFEYSDEFEFKADPLQQSMGIVTSIPSTSADIPTGTTAAPIQSIASSAGSTIVGASNSQGTPDTSAGSATVPEDTYLESSSTFSNFSSSSEMESQGYQTEKGSVFLGQGTNWSWNWSLIFLAVTAFMN